MYDYEVVVVGAGSGGCACAMRCADLGKKTALVEYRDKGTGGTCVARGCIPVKALLRSAQIYEECKNAKQYGIVIDAVHFDLKIMQQKKNAAVSNLKFGLDNMLLKPRGIARIQGKARLVKPHTLEISGPDSEPFVITAENIVLATGSEPAYVPAFHINGTSIITSDEALALTEIPKELIVIGAGAVGLEFAYMFSVFGSKVTILEKMSHAAPFMADEDIVKALHARLGKLGITLKCGVTVHEMQSSENKVCCELETGELLQADMALCAVGRTRNTADLGLDCVGVKTLDNGKIVTDAQMRTTAPGVYAVGDITEGPQLSHKAQKQGLVAAECIAGHNAQMRYTCIPWAVFMQPELAGVGMTAAEAEEQGIPVIVGKMGFRCNEKAMCMQKTDGLIKITARADNHRVLGGHIFGEDASVLIEELALAVDSGLTLEDIADSVHAHPTLSELIMETAKNALGKAFFK